MSERFKVVSAVHLFLTDRNKILLLRRFNTGYEDGNYSVPAGHIEGNEELTSAMIREAKEETGIDVKAKDLKIIGMMHRRSDRESIDFFLACQKYKGEVEIMEPDKCDELKWFDMDDLPENTIAYIRRAIENYQAGRAFDSFGWKKSERGKWDA